MVKSLKQLRIQFGANTNTGKEPQTKSDIHKYSMYLQSKDITWINKNSKSQQDDTNEIK